MVSSQPSATAATAGSQLDELNQSALIMFFILIYYSTIITVVFSIQFSHQANHTVFVDRKHHQRQRHHFVI